MKDKTLKEIFPIGTKLFFHSGNYVGLEGEIIDADYNSLDPRAIFGYLLTVKLSNGQIGYVEKSEHIQKIK